MKYFILIGDGMADTVIPQLQDKTPVEAARTPTLDHVARNGKVGVVRTIPRGLRPDTEVSVLSLLGYDPGKCRCGRAPFEAAALGIPLESHQMAFTCSLVTVDEDVLADYSAGRISNKEAYVLVDCLQENLSTRRVMFHPGHSFRHIMIHDGEEPLAVETTPPHDVVGEKYANYLPYGEGSQILRRLVLGSRDLLGQHEINVVRTDLGENPANMIWLWGQGRMPQMEPFSEKYRKTGAMITASPLLKGIAKYIGWDVHNVAGATGQADTDYAGKAEAALEEFSNHDIVLVHVAAPDVAGHDADPLRKVVAIENIDEKILAPVLKEIEKLDEYRVLVAANHFSPVTRPGHLAEPAPFAVYGTGVHVIRQVSFTERHAEQGDLHVDPGHNLMEYFLHEDQPLRKMELPSPPPQ